MMTHGSLDLDGVAAFILVAEMKSFTRAAVALDSTQSAVSVKIKRLEDRLGRRLLDRTPRLVRLSNEGLAFLDAARDLMAAHRQALEAFGHETRRLRLGVSDHLVGNDLPRLLRALAIADPNVIIDLNVAPSQSILDDFEADRSDAAIVLRHEAHRREGAILASEPFYWLAAPDFLATAPLRIATHTEACSIRGIALRTLDQADIAWTEAFTGGGLGTVAAAVSAGLAVAALARRSAPLGAVDVGPRLGLPPLPSLDIVLHTKQTDQKIRVAIRTLSELFRSGDGAAQERSAVA